MKGANMDISLPIENVTRMNPPQEKLFRLWNAVQCIVSDRNCDGSTQLQSAVDHENRIRRHYDQLLNNLNVPDVVTQMFQSGKLTAREHEHLRQFYSTPIRASEELLNIVILNSQDVYECFLESLKNAKQHHVYQMLTCDEETVNTGEQCMSQHSRFIRQNYDWLTETLNADSGLLTSLIGKEVLTQREYGQVVFENDPFIRNEIILSIISRKSVDDFKKFLAALCDTSQGHIAKRLTETPIGGATQNVAPTVIKTVPSDSLERRIPPKLPPKPTKQPPTTPPGKPLIMKPKPIILKPDIHPSKPNRTETRPTVTKHDMVHKKSVEYLETKFRKLPNELQTDVSIKLFLIHRKSSKDNIWEISFTKILQDSRNMKIQNMMQAKAADENCERLMQETIQRERECKIIREDLQREKTKAKTELRELQGIVNELQDRLNLMENENESLIFKLKKNDIEVESLKVLLSKRQVHEDNEKVIIIEKLKGDVKNCELTLLETKEELQDTKDKLIEKDLDLMASKIELKETQEMLKEMKVKLMESETKEIVTDKDVEVTMLDLRHGWEEERKSWSEEKKQLTRQIQELQQKFAGCKEKCLDLEQKLEMERSQKYPHHHHIPEQERIIIGAGLDDLPDKYTSTPVLVHTIGKKSGKKKKLLPTRTKTSAAEEEKKSIRGLTILDKELFVVSELSSDVEVYDSIKLSISRRWNLKELIRPMDIGSCKRNKCLYIFDCKGHLHSNEILRVDPNGKLIRSWPTGVELGYGLSVTGESNVVLTDYNKNRLNEYSPDGQLIREINLSNAGIQWPWHAIKLTNGHFVVSHGSIVDDLHRVCIVDSDGKFKKSFGGKCGSAIGQMNRPVYLSVDANGFVMVADQLNSRVFLLDSNLEFRKEILSKEEKHGLHDPWNIILDEINGRLFVADNESDNQRILIFDFK